MKTHVLWLIVITALFLGVSSCAPVVVDAGHAEGAQNVNTVPESLRENSDLSATTATPSSQNKPIEIAIAATPTAGPQNVGPNPQDVPPGYNPLTGLPVSDPSALDLPAVLISITNFPPSARPQSGLSFSPWVFEMYISEGMTRYLAAFYGDFPHQTGNGSDGKNQPASADVGPVRSGRLPYVYIRNFFQSACLIYAGATYQIREKLRGCASVFGSDSTDINSAMLDVTRMKKIAEQNKRPNDKFNYSGNLFSLTPATQGTPATTVNVFYSFLNQSQWQFDVSSGKYLKFEDFADGSGKFRPATDRLTGEQLAYSNVIVLFAKHKALNPYIIDINLDVGEKGKVVVFRNGRRFDAFWTTTSGDYEQSTGLRRPMRIIDADGNPFALKPGQSWVHIVTIPSEIQDRGGDAWLVRFYAPAGAK